MSLFLISPTMLTLMTSAVCASSCFAKGVSVTHSKVRYLLLLLFLPRKYVAFPVCGCSTQPGFNALHALLLGVIFDLLLFFINTYWYLQFSPSSAMILAHDYPLSCSLCLPETLCIFWITAFPLTIAVRASFADYSAFRNCIFYLSNAVLQPIVSHVNTYLSWMDSLISNNYRETNGQIFMSFLSKQRVFSVTWCKSSLRLSQKFMPLLPSLNSSLGAVFQVEAENLQSMGYIYT